MVKKLAFEWVSINKQENENDSFHKGYFDFLVSGQPLRSYLGIKNNSPVTPFGFFPNKEELNRVLDEFLLKQPTQLSNDRIELYICEKCGDILCGSITARIIDKGDKIVWTLFANQNGAEQIDVNDIIEIEAIEFDRAQYLHAFDQIT